MTDRAKDDQDADLARRASKGDRSAFNRLILLYQEPLYRFIRRYVGDADEAYDILQDALVAAWQAIGRLDPKRPALVWLRRIALNKCRDWGRRRTVRKFFYGAAPLDDVAIAEAQGDERDEEVTLARLDVAIAQLPMQLKEPLLLTVFEGLSHEEAGAALGITAKAIEARLYRARRTLASRLKTDDAQSDT